MGDYLRRMGSKIALGLVGAAALIGYKFYQRSSSASETRAELVTICEGDAACKAAVDKHFEPRLHPAPWPDAPEGRTRREIQARQKGLAVFRMTAARRETPLSIDLPRPDFDANRPRFRRRT